MSIPIEDHKWNRIPEDDLGMLPGDHYAEWARTGEDEVTVRIVGPNAHVFGKDSSAWPAITKAIDWFDKVGGRL